MNTAQPSPSNPSKRVLRESPPRALSRFTYITILCGGILTQIGSLFLFIGLLVSAFVIPNSEVKYLFTSDGEWQTTTGKIIYIEQTSAEVNEQPIFKYTFNFNVNGQAIENSSYGSLYPMLDVNTIVEVEYKSEAPSNSRIKGMNREIFATWIAFILLFPFIGLLVIFGGLYNNKKVLDLLKKGKFTRGTLLESRPTRGRVNYRPIMEYTFQFEAQNQTFTAKCNTHKYHLVENEEQEIILYDAENPETNIIYDAVPAVPPINRFGKFGQAPTSNLKYLIAPLFAIFSLIITVLSAL
ncbi:MAG: DUF3592 domain-containing protein [Saprospiraceae bacterium]|nr:DUF3592 domain-containing protein [Saprospiraceae bacterium]